MHILEDYDNVGLLNGGDLEKEVEAPNIMFDFNQTKLVILFQRLNQHRACIQQDFSANTRCEDGVFYRHLMGYGFLVLFMLAIIGNLLNLLVYIAERIRLLFAIQMLCTKLLVNTLTMLFLLPNALRSIGMWTHGDQLDQLYWKLWPYEAFFINVFGFIGMWMTVLMTLECFIHVFLPLKSKLICTKNNLLRSYMVIGLFAILLAGIYPLNRFVVLQKECDNVIVRIKVADSYFLGIYERFHMCFNLLFAIVIPLILLIVMCAAIVWRLNTLVENKPTSAVNRKNVVKFGSEKRSVMRITLITTSLQLLSELPSAPVFVYASLFGPSDLCESSPLCSWQTLSQFVGIFNVSLSFFVYLLFSPRFRQAIVRLVWKRFYRVINPSMFSHLRGQYSPPIKSNKLTTSNHSNIGMDETHLLSAQNNSVQHNDCLRPILKPTSILVSRHW